MANHEILPSPIAHEMATLTEGGKGLNQMHVGYKTFDGRSGIVTFDTHHQGNTGTEDHIVVEEAGRRSDLYAEQFSGNILGTTGDQLPDLNNVSSWEPKWTES